MINQEIFPQIILGFQDTSANMREATIRTMIPLTPFLDATNQAAMIKGLASLQEDQLPAIRTNVLVCLNKIIVDLDPNVRKQVLFKWIAFGELFSELFGELFDELFSELFSELFDELFDELFSGWMITSSTPSLALDVEWRILSPKRVSRA